MKRLAITSLIFIVLLLSLQPSSANVVIGDPPSESRPTLMITKWIDQKEVLLGETITVRLNITNMSNSYAYNLTITEPRFQPGVVHTNATYEEYTYVRIGFGASIVREYQITPRVTGEFVLEPTRIEYYDENNFLFRAQSTFIPFQVVEEFTVSDPDVLWEDIGWLAGILIAIPIIVYYGNMYLKR